MPPAAAAAPSGQLPPSSASQPAAATASDVSGAVPRPPLPRRQLMIHQTRACRCAGCSRNRRGTRQRFDRGLHSPSDPLTASVSPDIGTRTPAPTLPAPAAPLPSGPASPSAAPTTAPPSRPASQRRPSAPEPLPAQMNTEASPSSTNYRQASAATFHPAPTREPAPAVSPPFTRAPSTVSVPVLVSGPTPSQASHGRPMSSTTSGTPVATMAPPAAHSTTTSTGPMCSSREPFDLADFLRTFNAGPNQATSSASASLSNPSASQPLPLSCPISPSLLPQSVPNRYRKVQPSCSQHFYSSFRPAAQRLNQRPPRPWPPPQKYLPNQARPLGL
ncbi:hypothetical protein PC128_g13465 [Phytophthora cactorum]|nr:hypothetical protein PC128_g13465 [Phytophthora cactorum]